MASLNETSALEIIRHHLLNDYVFAVNYGSSQSQISRTSSSASSNLSDLSNLDFQFETKPQVMREKQRKSALNIAIPKVVKEAESDQVHIVFQSAVVETRFDDNQRHFRYSPGS